MSQRAKNGEIGEYIVKTRLERLGWQVINSNDEKKNHPNFDLIATKEDHLVRIQVKAKGHRTKASLAGSWSPGKPTFNKSENFETADFLVMVRFTPSDPDDNECFVFTMDEANQEVDWFAQQLIDRGKSTKHIYPYVSLRPRRSREYPFNTGEHWQPYLERWEALRT